MQILKVHIEYRRLKDTGHFIFRRTVTLAEGKITLNVFVCRDIECYSCLRRREFIEEALKSSGQAHSWQGASVVFENTGATSKREAVEFLKRALPTATCLELYSNEN